jgi:Chain length determinant protein
MMACRALAPTAPSIGVPMISQEPEFDQGIDLQYLMASIARRWVVVAISVLISLSISVLYLNFAKYKYTSTLVVAPAQSSSGKGLAGGLGGLASLAGVGMPVDSATGSFQLYVEGLHSRTVAEILAKNPTLMQGAFPDDWDAKTQSWREPANFVGTIVSGVKRLLGMPVFVWTPPDAARLNDLIDEEVVVDEKPKKAIVTISMANQDPAFANAFLAALSTASDDIIRARAVARTRDYIAYLTMRLETVTLAEHRSKLADSLSEQERTLMLASSGLPFAAESFGNPAATRRPTTPRPGLVLAGGMTVGLLLGIAIALLLDRKANPVPNRGSDTTT